jgi:ATP-binding protein involved in chromosome partitioning
MLEQTNVKMLGIVENMSYHLCTHCGQREEIFGHGGARTMSGQLNIPFLGEIPLDTTIRTAADRGMPVVAAAPDSPAGKTYQEIARKLAAQISIANYAAPKLEVVEEKV